MKLDLPTYLICEFSPVYFLISCESHQIHTHVVCSTESTQKKPDFNLIPSFYIQGITSSYFSFNKQGFADYNPLPTT